MLGFNAYTILLTMQASLICTPYIVRYPGTSRDRVAVLTGSSLLALLVLSAPVAIGAVVAGITLNATGQSAGLAHMFLAFGSAILFLLLRDFARQIAFAQRRGRTALGLDLFVAAAQLGGIALLGQLGLLNATSAFIVIGSVCAMGALGWYVRHRTQIDLDPLIALKDFQLEWKSTRWLFLSALLWCLSINIYPWLLAAFHGTVTTAAWGAALGVIAVINPIVFGVQNVLGPRIMHAHAEGGVSRLRREVNRVSVMYGGALALFAATLFVTGDALVTTVYGTKYANGGLLAALLSLNLAAGAFGFAFSRGLFALRRADVDFKVNVLALAMLLMCGVWLASAFGPVGAAFGQLFTNVAACSVRVATFWYCTRPNIPVEAV
jgi:O-antigen/teichoic acid export membrane protein